MGRDNIADCWKLHSGRPALLKVSVASLPCSSSSARTASCLTICWESELNGIRKLSTIFETLTAKNGLVFVTQCHTHELFNIHYNINVDVRCSKGTGENLLRCLRKSIYCLNN